MENELWFNYLAETFHEEHDLVRVILIGKDSALQVLQREDYEGEVINEKKI